MDLKDINKRSNKSYTFNEQDPTRPAQYWFQKSHEGDILFVVFYTQACQWSRCRGCNLPSLSSEDHVSYRDIMAQIDYLIHYSKIDLSGIDKIIISNNGSVLDQRTFSTTALLYFVAMLNIHCTNATKITIETRPEYVDLAELEIIDRALKEGNHKTELELAIGFEAYDDTIRNDKFDKGLSFEVFEAFVKKIAQYNFSIKCYFMLKPVAGISTQESISDIHKALTYINGIAELYQIDINVHINPTYVAEGTELEAAFNNDEYTPPTLLDVATAVYPGRLMSDHTSIYIGLDDEGLAVDGGYFIRPGDEEILEELRVFNLTQDYDIISKIININQET